MFEIHLRLIFVGPKIPTTEESYATRIIRTRPNHTQESSQTCVSLGPLDELLLLCLQIRMERNYWNFTSDRSNNKSVYIPASRSEMHGSGSSPIRCTFPSPPSPFSRVSQFLKMGTDGTQVAQMYTNVMIDFGIGMIPVVGDFADAWFKCNTRNNILLERYLREKGQKHPVAPPSGKPQQSK